MQNRRFRGLLGGSGLQKTFSSPDRDVYLEAMVVGKACPGHSATIRADTNNAHGCPVVLAHRVWMR
jgi:hypothetical protein